MLFVTGLSSLFLKCDVLVNAVGDILHDMPPLDRETTIPLRLLPVIHSFVETNRPHHLTNTNELPTSVYLIMDKFTFLSKY